MGGLPVISLAPALGLPSLSSAWEWGEAGAFQMLRRGGQCAPLSLRDSGLSSREATPVVEGFLRKGLSGNKEKHVLGRATSTPDVCAGAWGGNR